MKIIRQHNMTSYDDTRAAAQEYANATGYEMGLEYFALYKSWEIRILPRRGNRYGCDARCEVVTPEVGEVVNA